MSEENNNSASQSDWKKRELGALWRREGKTQNYLSGVLKFGEFGTEKEVRIVVFTNKGKAKNEKAPDFIVYEEKPREEYVKNSDASVAATPAVETAPVVAAEPATDSDLPTILQ
jgi:hypothetical protein